MQAAKHAQTNIQTCKTQNKCNNSSAFTRSVWGNVETWICRGAMFLAEPVHLGVNETSMVHLRWVVFFVCACVSCFCKIQWAAGLAAPVSFPVDWKENVGYLLCYPNAKRFPCQAAPSVLYRAAFSLSSSSSRACHCPLRPPSPFLLSFFPCLSVCCCPFFSLSVLNHFYLCLLLYL